MAGFSFDFITSGFLILLVLLPVIYLISRGSLSGLGSSRRAVVVTLRTMAVTLLILAIARMRLLTENDRLCVIFVVDRSDSIPIQNRNLIVRQIRAAQEMRDEVRGDYVGVVVFGKEASVEQSPRQGDLEFRDVMSLLDSEATNIQSAVQLAVAAFPDDVGGKRLVIFSDGNENHGQALEEIRKARALGVTVDVVPVRYEYPAEVSVEKLIVNPEVGVGQPFDVQVVIESTKEVDVKVRLYENDNLIPQKDDTRHLNAGRNYFEFAGLRRTKPGRYSYRVEVEPVDQSGDSIIENNQGYGFTMIQGEPKILLCAIEPENEKDLLRALSNEKIVVDVVTPENLPRDLEQYFDYGAIVFSNVGAHRLSDEKMKLFKNLVSGMGMGFVMIGGEESFGAGGYQGTAIEELLPVQMELKQKKILPNGALAMIVHSCELGNGNLWARRVIQQAIRVLSPRDYAGVIYFDSSARDRWLFPMTQCSRKQMMLSRLRGFNPGDMPSFRGIVQMAYNGLKSTKASIKHMIILSDGDPGPPSPALLKQIVQSRITISTICYGAHGNVRPPVMQHLAEVTGGKNWYLKGPEQLPEIFLREATKVRKSLISEKTFTPLYNAWGEILDGFEGAAFPALDGYVLTTAKPLADLMLVHPGSAEDPTQDPVLASWTYVLGKSVAFTSDAGRRWGKSWAEWSKYQQFWGQMIRWVARAQHSSLFRVNRQIVDGKLKVVVDMISEDGDLINGRVIKGSIVPPGGEGEVQAFEMRQIASGRYLMPEMIVDRRGTYGLSFTTENEGVSVSYTTGISVPYSPEYRRLATNYSLLARLASAGDGKVIDGEDEPNFFSRDFEAANSVQEIWSTLLYLALFLFFSDVFLRRVMIDYRAMYRKASERVQAFRRRRGVMEAPVDEKQLGDLLRAKKASTSSGSDSRWVVTDEDTEGDSPAFDSSFDASAAASVSPDPSKDAKTKSERLKKKEKEEEEESSDSGYTSRLLRAKKRAHGSDDET